MEVKTKINLQELYEIDDHLWLEKTIDLLKKKQFNELDLENLIEELESLGRRDKLAVKSLLEQVIRHLLLLEYWDNEYDRSYRHWRTEIIAFRTQLNDSLTTNLKNHLIEQLPKIYQDALRYVKEKSELNCFPNQCLYSLDQLLDNDWFSR
jgi:hypothetical protein